MALNSFPFICLFPLICAVYFLLPQRGKNLFLLIASYLFYLNWNPSASLVLAGLTAVSYFLARYWDTRHSSATAQGKARKWLFPAGGILVLLPLLLCKYYNFCTENIQTLLEWAGLRFEIPGLSWIIPIGISFYTFQAYAYLADVYHGKVRAERNPVVFALFLSFFPQTMCGPISRAADLLPQFHEPHRFDAAMCTAGAKIWLWGAFLKTVVADRTGNYVDTVYNNYEHLSGAICLLSSLLYSIQIYADFAGYSLMAVGIARCLGFRLVYNFRQPYFASGITDFWRRWHISLSTWLRDYVYIPLGGSRCSQLRTYGNILLTFFVSGLWHGASWSFILWGLFHGLFQVIEKWSGLARKHLAGIRKGLYITATFLAVNLMWIFFRMPTAADAIGFIQRIFLWQEGSANMPPEKSSILFMAFGISAMLYRDFRDEYFPTGMRLFENRHLVVRWSAYLLIIFSILGIGVLDAGQFIYANF